MRHTKYLFIALCAAASFVGCSFGGSSDESPLSGKKNGNGSDECTLTQGYWKNHPNAWPVSSLKLGTVTYTKDQAIAILKTPVKGNGLVQLAHQLIAAKLNVAGVIPTAELSAGGSAMAACVPTPTAPAVAAASASAPTLSGR